MKNFLFATTVAVALGALWIFNSVKPFNDVLGCYESSADKICILDNGTYLQLAIDGKPKNSAHWRSFKYSERDGEYTALVFYSYLTKSNAIVKEMEAQPQSNALGEGYFYIPESLNQNSPLLKYLKEEAATTD